MPTTRLLKDVVNIMKSPLVSDGIYYVHSETNVYEGYAMIIGPRETPYADGFYFFKFVYPKDYPFSPPLLKYCTNDGITRFNPNLYKNGKVCVSVLNTWHGPQWTSCQSIRSVLLTLLTLFIENPLLNEPGFRVENKQCKPYRDVIEYMNYKTAIHGMITQRCIPPEFVGFHPIIKSHITEHKDAIWERLDKLAKSDINDTICVVAVYDMTAKLDYSDIEIQIHSAFKDFIAF
jgi:ubiquitin-conjugating enzyme E2 Z